jgi:hypothetical protein
MADFDFAITVRRYSQRDVRGLSVFGFGADGQCDHVDFYAVLFNFFSISTEYIGGPGFGTSGGIAVDVVNAELGENLVIGIAIYRVLGAYEHL